MRRRVPIRRSGGRRVSPAGAPSRVPLDDRPLALAPSRDGKRLLVTLPFEACVVHLERGEVERAIALPMARPHLFEGPGDGASWIGGPHLYRGSLWSAEVSKAGSRLGGLVDRVALLRPTLLCGVGGAGEVLWDTEEEEIVHRRRAPDREVTGLVAGPDGRALFSDGTSTAWILDPDHPEGHTRLHLRDTAPHEAPNQAIVVLGTTLDGRCLLAAADGTVAWTHRALRLDGQATPREPAAQAPALALAGDETWVYALRPGGWLHRLRLAPPPEPEGDEPVPAPAESTRLAPAPTTFTLAPGGALWLGRATDGGALGELWSLRPEDLEWSPLPLGPRPAPAPAPEPEPERSPPFAPVRNKISGPPLRELPVDDVLRGRAPFWVTPDKGAPLERPVTPLPADRLRAADALLLPAMVRLREGTARPALLLWPGTAHPTAEPPALQVLTWGDAPRGWMPLDTPAIRAQGWSRRDVFPLTVALRSAPPAAPGRRAEIPSGWTNTARFEELSAECRRLLAVVW